MKMQNQCTESQFLRPLVEDELTEGERSRMETHIETCETCQHALDLLVDEDETAERVCKHLRRSEPLSDGVLLKAMDQIRSTSCGAEAQEPFRLDDFAVDYLRPSDDPDALGRLGTYDISEVIGVGGMGIVLKGHDAKLKRVVAVKILSPAYAANSTARKRFLREAQAAAAVTHPNVVTIHSVDEDRLPYLVMEFVDGPTLQQRLDVEGFLQLNQILRIGINVASGLAAAHAQGLVHRDIKPGNILLEDGIERARLTDFGLARAADDASVTRDGVVVGTPQYMSPEQARGETVEQTSDLFSLGSVLYTLATGRPPFRAESSYGVMRKITDATPTPIRELNPEIPEWLAAIVSRLMAKEKADRIQTAREVTELLETCLSHTQQPTVTKLPEIPKPPQTRRLSPFLKPLAGVTAMVIVTMGLLFVFGYPATLRPEQNDKQDTKLVATESNEAPSKTGTASQESAVNPKVYEKEFVVAFANTKVVGMLAVDIKRGSIHVMGYDGERIVVELSVPNYATSQDSSKGLKELRPNTLDFDVETSGQRIKLDGNSYQYITNLKIKVPRNTNLDLDTYQNGVVHVQDVKGTFRLRSHNNDIRLENVSGSGRVWSYNGSLTGDFETVTDERPLEFETYNGSIDLKLPKDTQANLEYRTGSGKVTTDFDVSLSGDTVQYVAGKIEYDKFNRGKLNGGGPKLSLETEKGDIRLLKRMTDTVR